jgi:hypothetical protein
VLDWTGNSARHLAMGPHDVLSFLLVQPRSRGLVLISICNCRQKGDVVLFLGLMFGVVGLLTCVITIFGVEGFSIKCI